MKQLNIISFIIAFLFLGTSASAQQSGGSVTGTVVDKSSKEPIAYVQVFVKGTTLGTSTDANGNYSIKGIPSGNQTIVARLMGYSACEEKVHIEKGGSRHVDLYLTEEILSLDGVVVSANRNETFRRQAPSLVTVLSPELFLKTNSTNLSQGLKFQPGLRVEDNCQNCGFNQVRINGLEGAYSQILIDSHPIFSSLAGVYGLEQMPANMIERVEVIRGGGSALFGSNAVGGVINVITKEPLRNSAEISHSTMTFDHAKGWGSFQNTTQFNGSMLTEDRKAGVMVFGQHNYRPGQDIDGDNFTELPNLRNRSLGFRSYYKTGLYSKATLEYHSMQEYRRGGDRLDNPPFEAQIAEYLQHYINGGSFKFDQGFSGGKDFFSLYASAQDVQRRSYYGGGDYTENLLNGAVQSGSTESDEYNNAFTALTSYGTTKGFDLQGGGMYRHTFGENWDFTGGLEYIYGQLDDRSGYRPSKIDQNTSTFSQYDQLEYKTEKLSALIGARIDYVLLNQDGKRYIDPLFIFSPRANVRYNPNKNLSFRLSYSEGFRAPQYFDEDLHVELAGGTPISRVLSPNLKEERSRSISASFDYYHRADEWQFNIMGEAFSTFISNQFKPSDKVETTSDGKEWIIRTIYNDKDGVSKVYGVNLEGRIAYNKSFDLQLGGTWQRSRYGSIYTAVEADKTTGQAEISVKDYVRTPNLYGYFVATVRPTEHFAINLSGTFTGKMDVVHEAYEGDIPAEHIAPDGSFDFEMNGQQFKGLAEGHAKLVKTPAFADIDLKLSHDFHLASTMTLELNAGIQNIFNSYQKDTDKGPGRASTYVYGPMQPRRIFVGTKINF